VLSRLLAASSVLRLPAIEVQVLALREQGITAVLDEAALVTLHPCIFAAANRIQDIVQVAQDVKLVEHDLGLRSVRVRRLAKWLPHISITAT